MLQRIKNLLLDRALYIAVLITLIIAVLSLVKFDSKQSISIPSSDKVLHGVAYCFLMLSWLYAFSKKDKFQQNVKYLFLGCIIYGIVIEALQGVITSYRTASMLDILANTGGTIVAILTFHFFEKKILRI